MPVPSGEFERSIIYVIVVAAIIAVALVTVHALGIVIPGFLVTIGWILVAACVGIIAIKFLMRIG